MATFAYLENKYGERFYCEDSDARAEISTIKESINEQEAALKQYVDEQLGSIANGEY